MAFNENLFESIHFNAQILNSLFLFYCLPLFFYIFYFPPTSNHFNCLKSISLSYEILVTFKLRQKMQFQFENHLTNDHYQSSSIQ